VIPNAKTGRLLPAGTKNVKKTTKSLELSQHCQPLGRGASLPAVLRFEGLEYSGPTALFDSVRRRPVVGLNTFVGRLNRLKRNGTLSDETVREALYSSQEDYRRKHGIRKTWVEVSGERIDLEAFYRAENSRAVVTYRTFWSRIRRRDIMETLDEKRLQHALSLSGPEWISHYGGGRHRSFVYEGDLYPEHKGRFFHGISAFLRVLGRYSERSLVWSRLKAGWDLDTALSIPVEYENERKGLIYKLTRVRTGQTAFAELTEFAVKWRGARRDSGDRHFF